MHQIRTKEGHDLEYDQSTNKVLVDGLPNKDWEPIFIKNGDDNDFYGYHNYRTDESYDLEGNKMVIDNDDVIKL